MSTRPHPPAHPAATKATAESLTASTRLQPRSSFPPSSHGRGKRRSAEISLHVLKNTKKTGIQIKPMQIRLHAPKRAGTSRCHLLLLASVMERKDGSVYGSVFGFRVCFFIVNCFHVRF
ncbi:hypothetical protein JOB18_027866 [Solea senegalensis]|uniref:Uncharacterized protein n=1 Tax=Solea senegalensis TaxID=28829 RepID=A0AAV6QIT1_SOLSE|nr:hypothetical protein JOB18_027866 [Solea senegalensis]